MQLSPAIAVVLAAGKGTRMRSALPKVLHQAAGRPLLAWVIDAARAAGCGRILVVVGHGAEQVQRGDPGRRLDWVLQAEQRGTGHALAQAEAAGAGGAATLLVLSGDVPLLTPATIDRLAARGRGRLGRPWRSPSWPSPARSAGCCADDGRRVPDRIVEARDATPEVLAVRRINAGLYALPAPEIFDYLREPQAPTTPRASST